MQISLQQQLEYRRGISPSRRIRELSISPEIRVCIIAKSPGETQIVRTDIEDIYPCTPLQDGKISLSFRSAAPYMVPETCTAGGM
ncbi:hypothetical protein BDV11DRAFT_183736 [Aspergillus similis]